MKSQRNVGTDGEAATATKGEAMSSLPGAECPFVDPHKAHSGSSVLIVFSSQGVTGSHLCVEEECSETSALGSCVMCSDLAQAMRPDYLTFESARNHPLEAVGINVAAQPGHLNEKEVERQQSARTLSFSVAVKKHLRLRNIKFN